VKATARRITLKHVARRTDRTVMTFCG